MKFLQHSIFIYNRFSKKGALIFGILIMLAFFSYLHEYWDMAKRETSFASNLFSDSSVKGVIVYLLCYYILFDFGEFFNRNKLKHLLANGISRENVLKNEILFFLFLFFAVVILYFLLSFFITLYFHTSINTINNFFHFMKDIMILILSSTGLVSFCIAIVLILKSTAKAFLAFFMYGIVEGVISRIFEKATGIVTDFLPIKILTQLDKNAEPIVFIIASGYLILFSVFAIWKIKKTEL